MLEVPRCDAIRAPNRPAKPGFGRPLTPSRRPTYRFFGGARPKPARPSQKTPNSRSESSSGFELPTYASGELATAETDRDAVFVGMPELW